MNTTIFYGSESSSKETQAKNHIRYTHNDYSKGKLREQHIDISKNNYFTFQYILYKTFLEIIPTHHNNNDKNIFLSFVKQIIQMKNIEFGYHTFFIRGIELFTTRALHVLSSIITRSNNVWVIGTTNQPCRVIRSLGNNHIKEIRCPETHDLCLEKIKNTKDVGDPLGTLCNSIIDKLQKKNDAIHAHIFIREAVYRLSLVYQPGNTGIIVQKMFEVMHNRIKNAKEKDFRSSLVFLSKLCKYVCEAESSICEANRDFYHLELFFLRIYEICFDCKNGGF